MLIGEFKDTVYKTLETCSLVGHINNVVVDGVTYAPTIAEGESFWASMVRQGHIKPTDIYWAFRVNDDGPNQWLAVRLDRGNGNPITLDLTSKKGQDQLAAIEKATAAAVEKKVTHEEAAYIQNGACDKCGMPMTMNAMGEVQCFFCKG